MAHNWDIIQAKPHLGLHYRSQEVKTLRKHADHCMDQNNITDAVKALSLAISTSNEILSRYGLSDKLRKKIMTRVMEDISTFKRLTVVANELKIVETLAKAESQKKPDNDLGAAYIGWRVPKVPPSSLAQEGFQRFQHCIKFPDKSDEAWNKIVGHGEVKDYIEESILFPIIFEGLMAKDLQAKGVLLYGPPGTGKTMIAHAIASKLDVCYIELKGSELLSKWLGESEKNIRIFYAMVEYLLPCILFIDEIDTLGGRRDTSSEAPESKRGISNQLLQEMEGKQGLFMVGATNMPWQIDPAFLRRIGKKCYVKLPNEKQRRKLIENSLEDVPHSLMQFEVQNIARRFEGHSSSDVCEYLKEVKARALKKLFRANYFAKNDHGVWYACSALNSLAQKMKFIDLKARGEKIVLPNLTCKDFETVAIEKTSVKSDIEKYEKFALEH